MERSTLRKHAGILMSCLLGVLISFSQAPIANFSASPVQGCAPVIVGFTDLSTGNPTSWNWDFGNGNTSTLRNPFGSYLTPGIYTITLTVTNAAGSNTMTKTQYISIYDNPTANFSAVNTSGCFPLRVSFTDLSTGGAGNSITGWSWDFGDGASSTLRNPTYTYNTAGVYTVSLTVTNDKGCSRTMTKPNYVTVFPGVDAQFTHSQPTVCRAPATITFTNNSTGPGTLSYTWDFGDGFGSNLTNPAHTYNSNGSFIPVLVVFSSSGCVDTLIGAPIVIGANVTDFTYPPEVCINEPATFLNNSTPAPISANWDFGDGNIAAGVNASHAYTAAGTYTVKLFNTYATCADSIQHTIVVNGLPAADFTAPVTKNCQPPLTVNFQDLTTPSATNWQWDFGDGGTSNLQNPSHTYTAYGSFNVTLIVTNASGCKDTIVKNNFIVVRRASISIPQLPAQGCVPFTFSPVPVINAVDNVLTYDWDFGDGGTSNLPNPTHVYGVQGNYTVRLIITTSTGCTDTVTYLNAVKVGTHPAVDFSASPIPVCANQPVQFTDLSVPADQWLWDFGDLGSSNLRNPTHRYQDTGYFSVRLVATNNGCSDTLIKSNYIYVLPPLARYNYSADCSNRLRFLFRDSSIAPLTWNWDFADGGTAVIANPAHIFPSLGTYPVRLIVTNGGCADTVTRNIKVIDEHPDFTANNTTACKTATINFQVTNADYANLTNYFWDFGDGTTINTASNSISHTYTASGTFTVRLIATDIHGCTIPVIKSNYIRINGPVAAFSNAPNVCIGFTANFNDLSTTDAVHPIVNWRWDFGDGSVQDFAGPPFQHTYNTGGVYNVKLVVTDAIGCKDSLSINNTINIHDPQAVFSSPDLQTCVGATVSFSNGSFPSIASSLWDLGDGTSSNLSTPTHVYTDTGFYSVSLIVTDIYGCKDTLVRTNYINVRNPKAGFTLSDTVSSCAPFKVSFTNSSIHFNSCLWDFGPGEGTSTATNPVHYYTIPGTYQVNLVITSPGGCKDSLIKSVTLYDTIGSRVDYLPLSGCKPLRVDLTAFTPGRISNFFWDFGDGNTAFTTTPTITHIYNSFGTFTPTLIMTDPTGCVIPVTGYTTINAAGAEANLGAADSIFCDVATVQFTDSTTFNDPVVSYNWTFGDGGNSSLQNPSHYYAAPGLYSVQLAVRTQQNCVDTFTRQNYIRVVQRPLIDIAGDTLVCIYSSLDQRGIFIQPDSSLVRWSWNFPNGNTSTLQDPPGQTYNTAGNFTVTAIATNSTGCRDTASRNITVIPLPTVIMPGSLTIQNGFPVTLPATYSPNTSTWLWSPSTGLSCTNCPTPTIEPKFNTNYRVRFTDIYGCVNYADLQVVVICKNMNLFIPNSFSPNGDGSNDIFYPRGKGLDRVRTLRVFNRWGEVVFEKRDFPVNDPSSGWNGTFRGTRPVAGVYLYQAEVFCENGELITINGNVALIL